MKAIRDRLGNSELISWEIYFRNQINAKKVNAHKKSKLSDRNKTSQFTEKTMYFTNQIDILGAKVY